MNEIILYKFFCFLLLFLPNIIFIKSHHRDFVLLQFILLSLLYCTSLSKDSTMYLSMTFVIAHLHASFWGYILLMSILACGFSRNIPRSRTLGHRMWSLNFPK